MTPVLCCAAVTSPEQILGIMERGFEHRKTGCHDINAHSSRSHCALIVHAASTDTATRVRSVGKLTLCDLAGSERINKTGATGDILNKPHLYEQMVARPHILSLAHLVRPAASASTRLAPQVSAALPPLCKCSATWHH